MIKYDIDPAKYTTKALEGRATFATTEDAIFIEERANGALKPVAEFVGGAIKAADYEFLLASLGIIKPGRDAAKAESIAVLASLAFGLAEQVRLAGAVVEDLTGVDILGRIGVLKREDIPNPARGADMVGVIVGFDEDGFANGTDVDDQVRAELKEARERNGWRSKLPEPVDVDEDEDEDEDDSDDCD